MPIKKSGKIGMKWKNHKNVFEIGDDVVYNSNLARIIGRPKMDIQL
jgi:hypothetical protein